MFHASFYKHCNTLIHFITNYAPSFCAHNILISSSMVLIRFSRCGGVDCFAGTQYANLTFDYMCSAACTLGMKNACIGIAECIVPLVVNHELSNMTLISISKHQISSMQGSRCAETPGCNMCKRYLDTGYGTSLLAC